jgi:hypothetical protein
MSYDLYTIICIFRQAKELQTKFRMPLLIKLFFLLEQAPRVGQKEELLTHLNKEIRFLIEGNYKIVHWIDENIVSIATVFDCRQNPQKLKSKNP